MGDVTTRTAGTVTVNPPTTTDLSDLRLHGFGKEALQDYPRAWRELLGKLTGMSRAEVDALPFDDFVRLKAEAETLLQSLS